MSNWDLSSGYGNSRNVEPVQRLKLVQTAGPTLSLITVGEMKNYLKMGSDTTDDNLIEDLIKASTKIIENECGGLSICAQTWKQTQTGGIETIELLRSPVLGIPTVSFYESFETTVSVNVTYSDYFRTVDNELYHVNGSFSKGREGDGYTITFNSGLFTTSDYTSSDRQELQALKTAICRTVTYLYENREEYITSISEGAWKVTYDGNLPIGIKTLIMPLHTGKGLI